MSSLHSSSNHLFKLYFKFINAFTKDSVGNKTLRKIRLIAVFIVQENNSQGEQTKTFKRNQTIPSEGIQSRS